MCQAEVQRAEPQSGMHFLHWPHRQPIRSKAQDWIKQTSKGGRGVSKCFTTLAWLFFVLSHRVGYLFHPLFHQLCSVLLSVTFSQMSAPCSLTPLSPTVTLAEAENHRQAHWQPERPTHRDSAHRLYCNRNKTGIPEDRGAASRAAAGKQSQAPERELIQLSSSASVCVIWFKGVGLQDMMHSRSSSEEVLYILLRQEQELLYYLYKTASLASTVIYMPCFLFVCFFISSWAFSSFVFLVKEIFFLIISQKFLGNDHITWL